MPIRKKNKGKKVKKVVLRRQPAVPVVVRARPSAVPPSSGGSLGRTVLDLAGKGLGTLIGGPGGGAIGSMLGNGVATFLGMGAYSIKRNTLVDGNIPIVHDADNSVRIRHREYIGDLISSGSANTFLDSTYLINPGNASVFPWLSGVAQDFQEYRVHGMIFSFHSESADALNSTNTALGSVMMAAVYNSADTAAFLNKLQMNNMQFAADGRPSADLMLPIECDPAQTPIERLFVRGAAVPSGQDARLYDFCVLHVATTGMQGTSVNIGDLWVSYDIELFKPSTKAADGYFLESAHYTSGSGPTNAAPLTSLVSSGSKGGDQIGMSLSTTVASFPLGAQGVYYVHFAAVGTAAAVTHQTWTLTNCAFETNCAYSTQQGVLCPPNTTSSTTIYEGYYLRISDCTKQATIGFGSGTLPSSITAAELFISQVNLSFL